MKYLRFTEPLAALILKGEKTATFRMNDEKGLSAGDRVSLLLPDGREFAKAQVTSVRETTFGALTEEDWAGHERYGSEKELLEAHSAYYKTPVGRETSVKVIRFRLSGQAIVARGAEAVLTREDGVLTKDRIRKGYRHPVLDSRLRRQRTRLEARVLAKAKEAGVNVPRVLSVDEDSCAIRMDFLEGPTLKSAFSLGHCQRIAEQICLLHGAGIIHGDLTTSNMILTDGRIFLIDFGLAKFSSSVEDRAVDLHVLGQALLSTHTAAADEAFRSIMAAYGEKFPEVAARLKVVEGRGRYRKKGKDAA